MILQRAIIPFLFCTWPMLAQPPFGSLDTPANGATNLSGPINVTGWALSVYAIDHVSICRALLPGESADCNGLKFIQTAALVAGARPDVVAAYPSYPNND